MGTIREPNPPRRGRLGPAVLIAGLLAAGGLADGGHAWGQALRPTTTPATGLPPLPLVIEEPTPVPAPATPMAPATPPMPEPLGDPEALPGSVDVEGDGPLVVGDLVEVVGEPEAEIPINVGRSRIFALKRPAMRIFIANPAIANIRFLDEGPNPKLLDIYGISFGSTTLTIWDEQERSTSIRLRVTIDTRDLERRLSQVFPGADIQVTQVGPQVILDGQVPDAKTMSEVLQIVRATLLGEAASVPVVGGGGGGGPPQVSRADGVLRTNFQEPVPMPVPEGGTDVQSGAVLPPAAGLPGAAGVPMPGMPMPGMPMPGAGPVGPGGALEEEALGATPPVSAFGAPPRAGGGTLTPGTIVNRVRVPGPRQILLKVKIAEINRTALRQLGVNWKRITDGAVLNSVIGNIGAAGSQLYGIFDEGNFSLFINALRQNSLAKILAEPNLVALDGQPAEFLAGGKFPYPVPQSATIPGGGTVVTIQFAQFGAILQFLPHILADDTIRLDVTPVFSELNFAAGTSVAGTTVPGINQRSARTVVQLREGQTLAIAGLLSTRTNATTARIPALGDLPIVGPWFSKNSIETTETELVVLVTPVLVDPLDEDEVPPSPGDRVWEPNDWEFYFLGRLEGRTGHPFRASVHYLDPLDIMKHFQSENHWVIGPHGHAD